MISASAVVMAIFRSILSTGNFKHTKLLQRNGENTAEQLILDSSNKKIFRRFDLHLAGYKIVTPRP
jgi:hypothetical protein